MTRLFKIDRAMTLRALEQPERARRENAEKQLALNRQIERELLYGIVEPAEDAPARKPPEKAIEEPHPIRHKLHDDIAKMLRSQRQRRA